MNVTPGKFPFSSPHGGKAAPPPPKGFHFFWLLLMSGWHHGPGCPPGEWENVPWQQEDGSPRVWTALPRAVCVAFASPVFVTPNLPSPVHHLVPCLVARGLSWVELFWRAKGLQLFNFQFWRWVKLGGSFSQVRKLTTSAQLWWEAAFLFQTDNSVTQAGRALQFGPVSSVGFFSPLFFLWPSQRYWHYMRCYLFILF